MDTGTTKIVVMGGSFNPPTLAHGLLMKEAINALGADKGIFVPVSDAYLRRKMRRTHPPMIFSPEMRIRMLESICSDHRMMVSDKEIGTIEARTLPTLLALQKDYPDAEIYFLMGADKLDLLQLLDERHHFLDKFKVVLFSREQADVEARLRENVILCSRLNRIKVLPQPAGTVLISSSAVRERLLNGESYDNLVCKEVATLLRAFSAEDFPDIIDRFNGAFEYLSNRYTCKFNWEGLSYSNAEAAFQSSKCRDTHTRRFFSTVSANKAAKRGKELVPPEGWEEKQTEIMTSILIAKFSQNPELYNRLVATGNSLLINGNQNRETFWGVDLYSWTGENNLGKILMKIRNQEV